MTATLLDIRVALRRSLMYVGIYGGGTALFLLLFSLAHRVFDFEIDRAPLVAFIMIGIPIIIVFVHKVRPAWQERIEKSFVGEKYNHRKQLFDFTTQIHNVPTLEQSGGELISLLAKSVDCGKACLLLQEGENGDLDA